MHLGKIIIIIAGSVISAACDSGAADAQAPSAPAVLTQKIEVAPSVKTETPAIKPADDTTHIIEIHKMKFQTKSLDVKIGNTVIWINKDVVPHTATAKDKSWDSGRLKRGESFTLTITEETMLDYFCFYHRQMKAGLVITH